MYDNRYIYYLPTVKQPILGELEEYVYAIYYSPSRSFIGELKLINNIIEKFKLQFEEETDE
jgi:hypothetical protein